MTSDFGVTPQPPASLTVEPDRFSDEAWELLLSAQDSARRWRHGDLDVEHLLQALFSDPRFQADVAALPLSRDQLLDQLEGFLEEQPMARGDELFVGEDLETLLEAADNRCGAVAPQSLTTSGAFSRADSGHDIASALNRIGAVPAGTAGVCR